jgi:hypothetical protein
LIQYLPHPDCDRDLSLNWFITSAHCGGGKSVTAPAFSVLSLLS